MRTRLLVSVVSMCLPAWTSTLSCSAQVLDLRDKPLPLHSAAAGTALDYHRQPVDLHQPLSQEPLVPVNSYKIAGQDYYARTDGFNAPYYRAIPGAQKDISCRQTVVRMLQKANAVLAGYGVELYLFDGYRSIETQRSLWQFFLEQAQGILKTDDPAKLRAFAGQFCSDPSGFNPRNPQTWPTHCTGGAVDVTLRLKATGELLFMGGIFDDPDALTFTDAFEHAHGQSAEDAARNRRLLYWAMTQAGFANYPYEWWHYDYGTQMWLQNSVHKPQTAAFYGPASLPASN